MAKPDITSLSYTELDDLKKDIDKQKKAVENENRKNAKKELRTVAAKYGYTLADLFGSPAKHPGSRKTVAAKYRNPANAEETWSGRGKSPRWLVDQEEAGKKREDFLIDKG